MKSTIDVDKKEVKEFPKLMRSEDLIVLMEESCHGTALTDTLMISIGEYRKSWNMNSFKDFDGKVTLEN